jgi:hypothetical protein
MILLYALQHNTSEKETTLGTPIYVAKFNQMPNIGYNPKSGGIFFFGSRASVLSPFKN